MATWNNQLRTKDYSTMTTFDKITEVPVNSEFINALKEAGASDLLCEVVEMGPNSLPSGVERNSARLEVQKYCYWADEISAEAIEDKQSYGGHFFQALWDGRLDDALMRADLNNQQILEELGYENTLTV